MRAQPATARRLGLGLAVVAALLSSAACAVDQQAQTASEKPTLDGTNATLGHIALRGLAIEPPLLQKTPYYPPGSRADVMLVIVNTGTTSDRLTSISSPSVRGWAAYRTLAEEETVNRAQAGSASAAPSTPAPSPSSSAGRSRRSGSPAPASGSASATASTSSLPQPLRSVSIPAGRQVSWGVPAATGALQLVGTKGRLYPASTIKLTFTFANAGSITVPVPIQLSETPASSVLPGPSAVGELP